jgi:hypothetical protein
MSTRDNISGAVTAIAGVSSDVTTPLKAPLAGLDTRGADAANLHIRSGAFSYTGTNFLEWRMQHSDTVTDGDFTAVAQADVVGATVGANGAVVKYDDTVAAPGALLSVGYIGPKRYVRVVSVIGGTVTAVAEVLSELTYLHREGKVVAS